MASYKEFWKDQKEALKWVDQLHPKVAQQLLFPTETPELPIAGDASDTSDLALAHAPTQANISNGSIY